MSGPAPFPREAMTVDDMAASIGGAGWPGLEALFRPAKVADRFNPEENVKTFLAAMRHTPQGRELVEWLRDLTFRAPYPHVGNTRDSAWLAAAKHEARVAVGQAIEMAIAEGDKILSQRKQGAAP